MVVCVEYGGCIVSEANSALSQRVYVERGALVCESIIFAGFMIGEGQ